MPDRRTLLAALTCATIALTLAACGGTSSNSTSSAPAANSPAGSAPAGRISDIAFAQRMIPHHRQAVLMADMALRNKTASAQVRSLATQIKKAQGTEITTMTGWLKSWNAPTTAGMSGMDGMQGMMSKQDMTTLGAATGATFNRQWLTMMITHHRGAITMSTSVLKTTSTPAVQQLARSIIRGQTTEITTMRALLTSSR